MNATDALQEWVLVPTAWTRRPEKFLLSKAEWGKVLKLSAECGYRPNDMGGFTKKEIRQLVAALQTALEQERVKDSDLRERVTSLLTYLSTTEAGSGFTMSYSWKEWSRVA
jgi:hypothetical protein